MSRMSKIVKHAYNTVPLYIKLADERGLDINQIIESEDWEKLPIITKDMVRKNNDALMSAHVMMDYINGKLINALTSGSTGTQIEIYWKRDDYKRSMLPLWIFRKKKYGISPNSRFAFFYTMHPYDNNGVAQGETQLGFNKSNLTLERMRECIYRMQKFEVEWIQTQPSMMHMIIKCMKQYNIDKLSSIKYIELTGEYVSKQELEMISEYMDCKVCNQYGANEVNSIAVQDSSDATFSIWNNNVKVEIIENGKTQPMGVEGDICITSLNNFSTPFIRYNIGDRGVLEEIGGKICLKYLKGRTEEWIEYTGGELINAYALKYAIRQINLKYGLIIEQCQIVQTKVDTLEVHWVISEEDVLGDKIEEIFISNISDERLKEYEYKFVYKDYIEQGDNGKQGFVINKIIR